MRYSAYSRGGQDNTGCGGWYVSVSDLVDYICFMLIRLYLCLDTFLENSLPAFVLFDSGASRSFVSRSFSREFSLPLGELECPLQVSVTNEHGIFASSVYQGSVLEIFGVSFPIDLILIPMGDICVTVGMDWLIHFDVMIDCEG